KPVKARDIAASIPTVTAADPVGRAVRIMVVRRLPGLVIVDDERRPYVVLPGTQVLRLLMSPTYLEDAALVRVVDEAHAAHFDSQLAELTVGSCLPAHPDAPAVVAS